MGKRILLGVTGGIAAYKSAELVRELRRQGHEVQVVMTNGAHAFVQPLTFQALSGHPVRESLLEPEAEAGMGHIELAKWADLVLVAPASADVMAKLAGGLADDLLTTVCLATQVPIALAPAMNQAMWRNARTQRNRSLLAADPQLRLWGPQAGDQACGDTGPGRMLEPAVLAQEVAAMADQPLAGRRLVITAGPTREALDPVRYISNHSSGRMGFALAQAASEQGAEVTLVAGPVEQPTPGGVARIDVTSALEMKEAVDQAVSAGADWFIATAAVADYRPITVADQKMKKEPDADAPVVELEENPDILASVAARTEQRPLTIGFAAETRDVADYARDKLSRKGLDLIVANDVTTPGLGFNSDSNAVEVFWADGSERFEARPKRELARDLIRLFQAHQSNPPSQL
ncbi:bifunctional phosphopantothenoylcysteine decarboxylase/phosphopantothenate--cysteine ligase CoaBC [Salicola sp. Rm-C-2C1-2]|uniref:bifunctional phosphopantothenoylcysteine decarboxylase/phosphopantothenate--cysteine ligase CoaBC n=1 Tax=Salicola sp. Rm-C-2C1-2 TaxID=3141321 RepID=UPI0032E3BF6A